MHDTQGATAIEYTMIASLIAAVIVAAVTTIGQNVLVFFTSVANGF